MKVLAVRGATTVDRNEKTEIESKTRELIRAIVEANNLQSGCTPVSLIISTTKDVTAFYPARAVRESGLIDVPLFSAEEPQIEGALPLCIRMLLTFTCEDERQASHVYLHGAATLRPDLKRNEH